MARLPILDGRSSAEEFLQEHDMLKRDVITITDENRMLKDQINQAENMVQVQAREIDAQRLYLREEQARTRMWLAYTMKLIGQMDAIRSVIDSTQQIARQAAQESQKVSMDDDMSDDDKAALAKIVGTAHLPQNRLS